MAAPLDSQSVTTTVLVILGLMLASLLITTL